MSHLEYQKKSNRIYSEMECHFHSVYEIYYFVSGDADIMVEGKIYNLTPHSLLVLAPNVWHGIRVNSRADYVRYCLFIEPDDIIPERMHLLTEILPEYIKNSSQELLYRNTEAFRLEHFFYNLKQLESQSEETKRALEPIFLEALVAQLYLLSNTLRPSTSHKAPSKVDEIINYINAHLTEPLTLDIVANHFFISKNNLNRTFKNVVGTTVIEYIRMKRVVLARQYIQDGESATNAALHVGFSDYSSFYRAYTKFLKVSPSKVK